MVFGIISIVVIIAALVFLRILVKSGLKVTAFIIAIFLIAGSAWICVKKPQMHKPFSIEAVEYLLKINKDGTMSTTKKTTRTIYNNRQGN